jgi:hypothetical protein
MWPGYNLIYIEHNTIKINRMRAIILLICAMMLLLTSCLKPDEYATIRDIPSETTMRIITKYYEPFLLDGEWVCGKELQDYRQTPDTTYYDKYDNQILRLSPYEIVKVTFRDAQRHRASEILAVYPISGYKMRFDFVVDSQGNLTEIKHYGDTSRSSSLPKPTVYKYNADGVIIESIESDPTGDDVISRYNDDRKLIEQIDGSRKMIVSRPPRENEESYVVTYQTIDENCQYSHNGIKGLVEESTEVFDVSTDLLKRKITKYYDYGVLKEEEDVSCVYDDKNRRIEETRSGKDVAVYYSVPNDLTHEESEAYIKKHYYSPPSYTDKTRISMWHYNEKDDLRYYGYVYTYGDDDYRQVEHYEYDYDSEDNWIRKTTYRLDINENEPDNLRPILITMREITYY